MKSSDQNEAQYLSKLKGERYRVLRQKGTEEPFSGTLLANRRDGNYHCAACGNSVFSSDTKFDSGCGWPSFYFPKNPQAILLKEDLSLGMHRVEVTCAKCGSHLGHVFNDAPDQPSGMRFCINSVALDFETKAKKKVRS
jgi:peptide-methionine (R)-S-oxide reductase